LPGSIASKSANALAKTPSPTTARVGAIFSPELRFPGQYYQPETGLNQNANRDYDPLGGGRYIESDRIGLYGDSWSTYAYVGGNRIGRRDPLGLLDNP